MPGWWFALGGAAVAAGAAFALTGVLRGHLSLGPASEEAETKPEPSPFRFRGVWYDRYAHVWLAATGGLGAGLLARSWTQWVTFVVVAVGLALLVTVDLAEQRLPDLVTLPLYPVLFGGLALDTWWSGGSWDDWLRALAAAAAVAGVFFVLVLLGPFYLGDVKLGGVIGGLLGWYSWGTVLVGVFVAFLVHALVGLGLMAAGRATRKTELAFGPSLVAGAVVALVVSGLT